MIHCAKNNGVCTVRPREILFNENPSSVPVAKSAPLELVRLQQLEDSRPRALIRGLVEVIVEAAERRAESVEEVIHLKVTQSQ